MHREKITSAIDSAMSHLGDSIRTLARSINDEKAVVNSLWLASSEIEYALFLFSLTHPDKAESPSWKHGSQTKQTIEAGPTMVSAHEFLKEAKNHIETGATEKAYEKTWTARNLLLKVQELFEKKRKTAAAQSTRTR